MKKSSVLFSFALLALCFLASCKKDSVPPAHKPPVVYAGPAQIISLPVESVTLTGKATDTASRIFSYLWSEVSGPNVAVLATEGSPSTLVSGLVPGKYIFQLMATDSFGLTGVDTVSITVNGPTVITLKPAHNPNETMLVGYGSSNYSAGPGSIEIGAEAWTINGNTVFVRAAFKFDLSTLPAKPFKSATLTLYSNPNPSTGNLTTPNAGTANAMFIQRINQSWDPLTATWATQPTTDVAGQILIPQTNLPTLDLVNIDVTAMVNTMISTNNYGFMIRLQNEAIYNSRIFCSSYNSDATKYPTLNINY